MILTTLVILELKIMKFFKFVENSKPILTVYFILMCEFQLYNYTLYLWWKMKKTEMSWTIYFFALKNMQCKWLVEGWGNRYSIIVWV